MGIRHDRRRLLGGTASGALALLGFGSVRAQTPSGKPLRLVVGFAAGTAPDAIARAVAHYLEESQRTSVIVDNRAGAGGALALAYVGAAAPDGTTLLMSGPAQIVMAPAMYRKLPFDPARLVPITELLTGDVTFVVGSQIPVKTMAEFLQWSRDKSPVMVGTFGPGTPHHLVAVMLGEQARRKVEPVHYRAGADALTGLVMGELHAAFVSSSVAQAWQQAGKATVLAVSTPTRSPIFPNVQTLREAGLGGAEFSGWSGVFAPPGTPPDVADRLNATFVAAARAPSVKAAMEAVGFSMRGTPRQDFEQTVANDRARYAQVIQALGLKLD